jgi:hypothetical protein
MVPNESGAEDRGFRRRFEMELVIAEACERRRQRRFDQRQVCRALETVGVDVEDCFGDQQVVSHVERDDRRSAIMRS